MPKVFSDIEFKGSVYHSKLDELLEAVSALVVDNSGKVHSKGIDTWEVEGWEIFEREEDEIIEEELVETDPVFQLWLDSNPFSGYVPTSRLLELIGTTNQVTVSPTGGQDLTSNRSWTLALPQNIHSEATPTFGGLTLNGILGLRATPTSTPAAQFPVFIADPASATRTLVTRTPAQVLSDIGAQAALTNPVTGTGVAGRLAFWNGANSITSDGDLLWDSENNRLSIGNISSIWALNVRGGISIFDDTSQGVNFISNSINWANVNEDLVFKYLYDTKDIITFFNGGTVVLKLVDGNAGIGLGSSSPTTKLDINGDVKVRTIDHETTDTDKFLVSSSGIIKYRTGTELLSDIGAQASGNYVTTARTLTVNGTTDQISVNPTGAQDLSANRSWTLALAEAVLSDIANGVTAYEWGDHALANYLSKTENTEFIPASGNVFGIGSSGEPVEQEVEPYELLNREEDELEETDPVFLAWLNDDPFGGIKLVDLADVTVTSLVDGDIIRWNDSTQRFVNVGIDFTSLGYWTAFDSGIRSDNGLISIRDDSGAHEMLLGYDWHGGDYALTLPVGENGILIAAYDETWENFRYGGSFPFPYMTLSDSKLVVNNVSSDPQIRTTYIANAWYNDDLESTPSAHILLYDDGITAYRAVTHEFENPYASQGAVIIAADLDLHLYDRDRTTALSYVLGTNGSKVIERTVANFISDNNLLSATLVNKGDILVYDGNSLLRFPKGEDGQVLYSDSGEPQGLIWDWPQSSYWGKNANNVVYTLMDGDSIGIKVGTTVYQALAMPNSSSFVLGNGGENMTGINNTIIGNGAAPNITSGYQNIIAGTNAGNDLTTGYQNVLLGYLAGGDIVSGYGNMAFGTTALWKATGNNNVGIGAGSGFSLVTGNNNIYIGDATGQASESRMFYVSNIVKANMSLTSNERYFEILDANVIADTFNGVALTNGGSSSKFLAEDGTYYVVDSGSGMTNPMTTTGDIIYQNSSGNPARLGATTDGYILSLVSGIPAWVAPSTQSHGNHTGEITSSGLATTLNKTAISNRTALGSLAVDDYLLVYDTSGSNIYKSRIDTLIKDTPTNGQTQYGISSNWAYDHSNTFGNEAHVPAEPSTDATLKYLRGDGVWAIPAGGSGGGMVNPMTTTGDMIYYGSSNPSRLGIGTSDQILQTYSGYPMWVSVNGEGALSSGGLFSITKEAVMNRAITSPGDNTYLLGATTGGFGRFTVASLASYILPLTTWGDFIIANELGNAERFAKNNTYTKSVITQVLETEIATETITEWTPFAFTSLIDTPSLSGNAGRILGVNGSGTGLIWVSPSTNSVTLTGAVTGSGTGTVPTTYNQTVPVNKGGTGQTFYTIGDILYANSTSSLAKLSCSTSITEYDDPAVLQQYYNTEIVPARRSTSFAKLPKIAAGDNVIIDGHIYGKGTISFSGGTVGDSLWDSFTGYIKPKSAVDVVIPDNKILRPYTNLGSDLGMSGLGFDNGHIKALYSTSVYFGGGTTYYLSGSGNATLNEVYQQKAHSKEYKIQNSSGVIKWTIKTGTSDSLEFYFGGTLRFRMTSLGDMEFFKS